MEEAVIGLVGMHRHLCIYRWPVDVLHCLVVVKTRRSQVELCGWAGQQRRGESPTAEMATV